MEQRGWEELTEVDAYDVAVALGVFDYVGTPVELLGPDGSGRPARRRLVPVARSAVEPAQGPLRGRGVAVHGYGALGFDRLALDAGMEVVEMVPLDRAGYVVHFRRRPATGGAGSDPATGEA